MKMLSLATAVFLARLIPAANPDRLVQYSIEGNLAGTLSSLQQGADPNEPNAEGLLPMPQAALHGHVEVVEALLREGAEPEPYYKKSNRTLITSLLETPPLEQLHNLAAIFGLLLGQGADPNRPSVDLGNSTALIGAAYLADTDHIYFDVAKVLLVNGANPNWLDDGRYTPLKAASTDQMTALLLAWGAVE